MRYLTAKQILALHDIIIQETGGSHGVRDLNSIATLEKLPKQAIAKTELYPTLFIKAALYVRNIITEHPFVDGNKRTGMITAGVFLNENNYEIDTKIGEIEKFALQVIEKKLSLEDIAKWLKKHSKATS